MVTKTYRSGNDEIGYCTVVIHDPRDEPVTESRIREALNNRRNLERCVSSILSNQSGAPVSAQILWDDDLEEVSAGLQASP